MPKGTFQAKSKICKCIVTIIAAGLFTPIEKVGCQREHNVHCLYKLFSPLFFFFLLCQLRKNKADFKRSCSLAAMPTFYLYSQGWCDDLVIIHASWMHSLSENGMVSFNQRALFYMPLVRVVTLVPHLHQAVQLYDAFSFPLLSAVCVLDKP